jgi:hypothetical protein
MMSEKSQLTKKAVKKFKTFGSSTEKNAALRAMKSRKLNDFLIGSFPF